MRTLLNLLLGGVVLGIACSEPAGVGREEGAYFARFEPSTPAPVAALQAAGATDPVVVELASVVVFRATEPVLTFQGIPGVTEVVVVGFGTDPRIKVTAGLTSDYTETDLDFIRALPNEGGIEANGPVVTFSFGVSGLPILEGWTRVKTLSVIGP